MKLIASELRVGNFYIGVWGSICRWREGSFEHYKNANLPLSKLKPIPLNKEWILGSFGFKFVKTKSGTQGVYSDGKMNLTLSNSGNFYRINLLIPNVHQLQNLYFALTGEELTIK